MIEIMIVVVIMAMIAAAAGVGAMGIKHDADVRLAKATVHNIATAVEAYSLQNGMGECPTVHDLATARLLRKGTEPNDPWGQEYDVTCEEADANVRSSGPDGQSGTADDIALY